MTEMTKHGQVGLAAVRAGMDRKTARKYVREGKLPSDLVGPRTWRTRTDPFVQDWGWVEEQLKVSPTLEAKTLFEVLCEQRPEAYEEGQLRTLQRHVKQWRAASGPDREVFFPQQHRPGEAAQTDFTWGTELGITILGVAFAHMLCHFVLPFSNWQWATVCASESIAAIKRGVQAALFRLGRHPRWHQTDNSTAATHRIGPGSRDFNDDYVALMTHFGMKPRTTEIGAKEQNGDVEAGNGALKRRLEQALLLRGDRDFAAVELYESWMQSVCAKANAGRTRKVSEELVVMDVVDVSRLPEHIESDVTVTAWSTIRVAHNTYSVPSRLIHETLRVHLYERHLDVHYGGQLHLTIERLPGRNGHSINYRDIIWSLVQKPGAFSRYRYREALFPTLVFRRAYDAIIDARGASVKSDLVYLRILHLAAATMESDVELAVALLLDDGTAPDAESVRALVKPAEVDVPVLVAPVVDLHSYDTLLASGGIS